MNAENISSRYDLGIAVRRWLATVIDFILFLGSIIISVVSFGENPETAVYTLGIVSGLIVLQYFILEPFTGYTIGKFIFRIKVVDIYGSVPGLWKGILRTLCRLIEVNPFLLGGLPAGIIVLCSKNKQRLGDMAAKTYVLKVKDLEYIGMETQFEPDNQPNKSNNGVIFAIIAVCVVFGSIIFLGIVAAVAVPKVAELVNKSKTAAVIKNVYTTPDGKAQFNLPQGWEEEKGIVSGKMNAGLSKRNEELYLTYMSENKKLFSDKVDLDKYSNIINTNFEEVGNNPIVSDAEDVMINGYAAKQFKVDTEVEDMNIAYLLTIIEGDNNYYVLMGWTSQLDYDKNREELLQLINSFKEVAQN